MGIVTNTQHAMIRRREIKSRVLFRIEIFALLVQMEVRQFLYTTVIKLIEK